MIDFDDFFGKRERLIGLEKIKQCLLNHINLWVTLSDSNPEFYTSSLDGVKNLFSKHELKKLELKNKKILNISDNKIFSNKKDFIEFKYQALESLYNEFSRDGNILYDLNVRDYNISILPMLVIFGLPLDRIIIFLSQPIISEYIKEVEKVSAEKKIEVRQKLMLKYQDKFLSLFLDQNILNSNEESRIKKILFKNNYINKNIGIPIETSSYNLLSKHLKEKKITLPYLYNQIIVFEIYLTAIKLTFSFWDIIQLQNSQTDNILYHELLKKQALGSIFTESTINKIISNSDTIELQEFKFAILNSVYPDYDNQIITKCFLDMFDDLKMIYSPKIKNRFIRTFYLDLSIFFFVQKNYLDIEESRNQIRRILKENKISKNGGFWDLSWIEYHGKHHFPIFRTRFISDDVEFTLETITEINYLNDIDLKYFTIHIFYQTQFDIVFESKILLKLIPARGLNLLEKFKVSEYSDSQLKFLLNKFCETFKKIHPEFTISKQNQSFGHPLFGGYIIRNDKLTNSESVSNSYEKILLDL